MFGGLAFLLNGNMAFAAGSKGGLMLRVDPAELDSLAEDDGVAPFEMRGRPMKGWVLVDSAVIGTDEQLQRWVDIGLKYAGSLPPK
jgi:hypothetical protein